MLITKLLNVVSQTTGLQCHYGSRERLNDELDDATFPCAFVFLMQNGNIQTDGGQICESSNVGVFVVDKTDYDFETIENAEIIEQCKQRIDRLIFGLYGSDSLQLNQINNTTQIYDEFDVILTGYAVEINVTEIYGTACVGAVIPEPHPYALQDKTVTPSSIQQIITADSGYYGLGHVTVGPGQTCELQEKEIEVVENGQSEITPDEGYNGISKLTLTTNVPLPTIEPQKEIDINQNGYFTIDPSTNFDAMSKVVAHVDVPQTRVQALRAFQINKDNVSLLPVRIEPSANYDAMAEVAVDVVVNPVTVEATTQMQTVTPHEYGLAFFDGVTINPVTRYIDSNIQPQNIKKDITILGVTGTFEGGQSTRCPISLAQNVVPQSAVGVVDLSWADLSYTRSLSRAFYYCRDITEVYFGNQSMNVTNGANCFIGCNKLISIVGSRNIITNTCTDLQYFFYDCDKLQYVDVSDWDTSNVLTFTQCFRNCKKLEYLDLRSWRLDSATSLNLMFNATQMLSTIRVGEGWTKGVELTSTGLTHDGILQFFNDLPTISDAQTITLGATKLGYMSDAEKAIAQNKGWTLS